MSVSAITVAPGRVRIFFDPNKAPSPAVDQHRIAQAFDTAMALAPRKEADALPDSLPLAA
jgi:hypothetical protein